VQYIISEGIFMKTEKQIYQIKVVLAGSKPSIWRRILVPSDISLVKLHDVLQIAIGWENCHLHQFKYQGKFYLIPDEEFDVGFEREDLNEKKFKLDQLLKTIKDSMVYEYDFGDGWEHKITLEKILPFENKEKLPRCISGKMSCPPEDCGGIWGYYNLLDAIQDEDHPEHDSMLEWLGEGFDPEYFDMDEINSVLARI